MHIVLVVPSPGTASSCRILPQTVTLAKVKTLFLTNGHLKVTIKNEISAYCFCPIQTTKPPERLTNFIV